MLVGVGVGEAKTTGLFSQGISLRKAPTLVPSREGSYKVDWLFEEKWSESAKANIEEMKDRVKQKREILSDNQVLEELEE